MAELWMLISAILVGLVTAWLVVFGVAVDPLVVFLSWVTVSFVGLPVILVVASLVEWLLGRAALETDV